VAGIEILGRGRRHTCDKYSGYKQKLLHKRSPLAAGPDDQGVPAGWPGKVRLKHDEAVVRRMRYIRYFSSITSRAIWLKWPSLGRIEPQARIQCAPLSSTMADRV
jgi:hypothetical protein